MAIVSPIILLPTNGRDYATDMEVVTLSGTTSSDTQEIQVNGSLAGVSYTTGEPVWSWTGTLVMGINTIRVVAIEKVTLQPSLPTNITITLITSTTLITVSAPTGVRLRSYQDAVEILNVKNPEPQTVGYNYYFSTKSGGVDRSYVLINKTLVIDPISEELKVTELNRAVDTVSNLRVTTITEEIERVYYYGITLTQERFNELVEANLLDPVPFNEDTPLYFVVTAMIYDTVSGQVTESAYSAELEGSPIVITTGVRDLPSRTQSDIILTFGTEMMQNNAGIDTKPGTVIRDVADPISEEQARVYIIQDFMARSLSVGALLYFDDADGDKVSDPVSTSTKKRALQMALNFQSVDDVQTLINEQFDKLASNVNVIRKPASPATGTVTFYTTNPPIRDMYVYENGVVSSIGDLDAGIPSQNYKVLSTKVLTYADRETFYNTVKKRYELTADVEALNAGSSGNTDAYTIVAVSSGIDSDFFVENPNPVSFGVDIESNYNIAGRIQLAMFADTGTEGGYVKTAIAVPMVHNARVEKAGDSLMIRDFDEIRNKHVGGKVDIYIQGERIRQISDQIAFSFGSVSSGGAQVGEAFQIINASAFQFKTLNPRVSAHTPIFEVTRVYNSTRSQDYDLTGYQIIGDGTTIDLDETLSQNILVGLASSDTVRVDYKYRNSDIFILQNQPVLEIVSVVGQLSGALTVDNYELVRTQDPLADGNSTIAQDGIRIKFANNLPVTGFQTIANEPHVLILDQLDALDYLGADPESIVVKNSILSVTYSEGVDYAIHAGTDTTATSIELIESGSITNGEEVLISYNAIENFKITYTTNALLSDVQTEVNTMKHACADVIVKQAIENKVDFVFVVIPKTSRYKTTDTDDNRPFLVSQMQTALYNYISQLDIGTPLTQSEVVRVIQSVPDVYSVVIPFSRMVKADGSFITRDDVGKVQFEVFNDGLARSYITTSTVLTYKTIDQGGSSNYFRGVFEDGYPLVLQSDPLDVSGGSGRAYIRADGKLIISTRDGQIPDDKYYQASYFVYGETGTKDINVASIEYLTVGTFSVTFDTLRSVDQVL